MPVEALPPQNPRKPHSSPCSAPPTGGSGDEGGTGTVPWSLPVNPVEELEQSYSSSIQTDEPPFSPEDRGLTGDLSST